MVLAFTSCIAINENNYRLLRQNQMKYIQVYSIDLVGDTGVNKNECYIYEINCPDIKEVTRHYSYTWIHLWRPYCKGDICQNIKALEYSADKFKTNGFALLLVSETYDLKEIQEIVRQSAFSYPVFVLEDRYFGHSMKGARIKFIDQLANNDSIRKNVYHSDFLFRDTLLIYATGTMNMSKLDSLVTDSLLP